MRLRTCTRLFLLAAMLASALGWTTSVQALAPDDTKVIWCPADVGTPKAVASGCTPARANMDDLVDDIYELDLTGAGTIWIGKGYNGVGRLRLNGDSLLNIRNSPLTVKGGWNGLGTGSLDPNAYSTLDGSVVAIYNWTGAVTLGNLKVQNAPIAECGAMAVCVRTMGSIKLDRVQALNNTDRVAGYLDNSNSTSSPPASITVTNSQFNHNEEGLAVLSKGLINLSNIRAEGNNRYGAFLDNAAGTANVLLKSTNSFLGNGRAGLVVLTKGNFSATHLLAYNNGTAINENGVDISAGKAVTITGSGRFHGNGRNGLQIHAGGRITAKNLTASGNTTGDGIVLTSALPGSSTAQAVTLSHVNADRNGISGIAIFTDGKVSLTCVSAYDNTWAGLYVRNRADTGPAGALTLKGYLGYSNFANQDLDLVANQPVTSSVCP